MKKILLASLAVIIGVCGYAQAFDYFGYKVRAQMVPRMSPDSVTVAAVQIHSEFGEVKKNSNKIEFNIRQAAKRGAKIIVLPEGALQGYISSDHKAWRVGAREVGNGLKPCDPSGAAETVPGEQADKFCELAKKLKVYIALPLIEVDRKTNDYYSTCLFIGPEGEILLHYRKLSPFAWADKGWVTVGNRGTPVVDTPYGRIGILICVDIHKQADAMKRLGVDIVIHPIAWVDKKNSDWFEKKLPLIASKNNFSIVAANWTFSEEMKPKKWAGYGQSRIIDNTGAVRYSAKKNTSEEIVYGEIVYDKSTTSYAKRKDD